MSLITISHSIGSGGITIAQQVAKQLDLEIFDDHRLQSEAVQMGIRPEELKLLDEKAPGLLDRLLSRRPQLYLDLMEALIYKVAKSGSGVIVGHGSHFILRDFNCALHVRVLASFDTRVKRLMSEKELGRKSAEKILRKHTEEIEGYLKYIFKIDRGSPYNFDFVINTDKMTIDLAVELIVAAAQAEMYRVCSDSAMTTMAQLSLSKKIQAELLRQNINRNFLHLEVSDPGIVSVRGFPKDEVEQARIIDIIKAEPGVTEVRSEFGVAPVHGIFTT